MKSLSGDIMVTLHVFVLGLAVFQLTSSVVSECDPGWDEYQGFCYRFYPQTTSGTQYHQAQATCESEDSHLVSITSAGEDDFVKNKQIASNNGESVWLGKKNIDTIWADGLPVNYTNYGSDTRTGDCLAKFPSFFENKWFPSSCASLFGFMCKKALVAWTPWGAWSACDCSEGMRETRIRICHEIAVNRTSASCPGDTEENRACSDSATCLPASRTVGVLRVTQGLIYQITPDWSVQVRTAMECARQCVGDQSCVSFSFHDDGACKVFSHSPETSTPTVRNQGASFWTIIERQLILDY